MKLKKGMRVVVHGRYEDLTDPLDGVIVTIRNCIPDKDGYIEVDDSDGWTWYVQAKDVTPCED